MAEREVVIESVTLALEEMIVNGINLKKGTTQIPITVHNDGDDVDFATCQKPYIVLSAPDTESRKLDRERSRVVQGATPGQATRYSSPVPITLIFTIETFCSDPRQDSKLIEAMCRKIHIVTSINVVFENTATPQEDNLKVIWHEDSVLRREMLPTLRREYKIRVLAWFEILEGETVELTQEFIQDANLGCTPPS
jgi:hypothetical protein